MAHFRNIHKWAEEKWKGSNAETNPAEAHDAKYISCRCADLASMYGLRALPPTEIIHLIEVALDVMERFEDESLTHDLRRLKREQQLRYFNNLSFFLFNIGDASKAADYASRSAALAHELGAESLKPIIMSGLGAALHQLGEVKRAFKLFKRASASSAGSRSTIDVAVSYTSRGYNRRAIRILNRALKEVLRHNDRWREGSVKHNLAVAYMNLRQYERAIKLYTESLEISRELGEKAGEETTLSGLGLAYYYLGDLERAMEVHNESLRICREIGQRAHEGEQLGILGVGYSVLGKDEEALQCQESSLSISRELGDSLGEGSALHNLSTLAEKKGDLKRAIALAEQALAILESIESPISTRTRKLLKQWRSA